MEVISRDGTTAQIDPLRFCRWLFERCQERGVRVRYPARAMSVSRDGGGALNAVRISQDGEEVECELRFDKIKRRVKANGLSTMYTPCYHVRRMVASRLQYPLSHSHDTYTRILAGWTLATRAQPAFQAWRA